jgi:hypothetical protein
VIISLLPQSENIYKAIQKRFGRLKPDPDSRLLSLRSSIGLLEKNGYSVTDKIVFEVGSGHELISPLGWYVNGASSVISVDLNERLDLDIFRDSLTILGNLDGSVIHKRYFDNVDQFFLSEKA